MTSESRTQDTRLGMAQVLRGKENMLNHIDMDSPEPCICGHGEKAHHPDFEGRCGFIGCDCTERVKVNYNRAGEPRIVVPLDDWVMVLRALRVLLTTPENRDHNDVRDVREFLGMNR